MTELKPCPFCGSEVVVDNNKYTKVYSIACGNPECYLSVSTLPCQTSKEAIDIWNRRINNVKTD